MDHFSRAEVGQISRALKVPDQLKSGVTRASRYEPQVQRAYAELAAHYNTVVVLARSLRPRDKATGCAAPWLWRG